MRFGFHSGHFVNRFVNIFMLVIVVTCPVRCLAQGCGCYQPFKSFCALNECCSSAIESQCCSLCERCESCPAHQDCPQVPRPCKCSCFCSGVIVADIFSLPNSTQGLFEVLELESMLVASMHSQALCRVTRPPDPEDPLTNATENVGRHLRCQYASFLI